MKDGVEPENWKEDAVSASGHDLADAAARVLRRLHAGGAGRAVTTSDGRRNQAVARVRLTLERRSGSSVMRHRVAPTAFLAVVALAAAAVVVWLRGGGDRLAGQRDVGQLVVLSAAVGDGPKAGIVRPGDGARNALALGMTLAVGTRVIAPATSEIDLGTSDGTSLALEKGGALTIVEQSATRHFSLVEGAVRARVAKLEPGERFLISTEDAQIEVHGTSFRVATVAPDSACGGSRTRVSVMEGVVSVRARGVETRLQAGGEWPAGCRAAPETPAPPAAAPPPVATRTTAPFPKKSQPPRPYPRHAARASTSALPPTTEVNGSTTSTVAALAPAASTLAGSALAGENDLLTSAIRARRQDRPVEAEHLLKELIERHPNGPLLETAMAQRMRVLGPIDRSAAAAAAVGYLTRFPRGFARDEARRLAGAAP